MHADRVNTSGLSLDQHRLSYCGQDCRRIPPTLGKMYGDKVLCLDLSYNALESLKGLEMFTQLQELILDNNKLSDNITFPCLRHLKTLSLNNNQITNVEQLLGKISSHMPGLTYLSLLSNPGCPDQLSNVNHDDCDYQRYRFFVLYTLPCLRFLDSRRVASSERTEARMRGQFTGVHRPSAHTVPASVTQRSGGRRLPLNVAILGCHRGAYGKCSYTYTGKHSEGNRFILNSDL